jgi:aspartyl-tRNA(Asn)/glutamyl-tRNA(Gln) amidotransferase subunit C
MKITDKDVAYVADLANLELTAQERERMAKDLNSILDYIDRLNELETTNVPPMAQSLAASSSSGEGTSSWREDELRPCLPREDALKNAPDTDGSFFKVPKVIEK